MSNGLINRQYVGARYVPKIVGEWNKALQYEALSVVTYMGNSFTSKVPVPANVDITNENYWVNTGNYNAQLENINTEIKNVKNNVSNLRGNIKTILDYGGYNDGTHANENTNALINALNDNKCVYFPSGNYSINFSNIILNNKSLIGEDETIILPNNDETFITLTGGCNIVDLKFNTENKNFNNTIINCYGDSNNITNVTIIGNGKHTGINITPPQQITNTKLNNLYLYNLKIGVNFDSTNGWITACSLLNSWISNCRTAVKCYHNKQFTQSTIFNTNIQLLQVDDIGFDFNDNNIQLNINNCNVFNDTKGHGTAIVIPKNLPADGNLGITVSNSVLEGVDEIYATGLLKPVNSNFLDADRYWKTNNINGTNLIRLLYTDNANFKITNASGKDYNADGNGEYLTLANTTNEKVNFIITLSNNKYSTKNPLSLSNYITVRVVGSDGQPFTLTVNENTTLTPYSQLQYVLHQNRFIITRTALFDLTGIDNITTCKLNLPCQPSSANDYYEIKIINELVRFD